MQWTRGCASSAARPTKVFTLQTMTHGNPVLHIRGWQAEFTDLRRDLHMHPELGFEEHRTAKIVAERLTALGIEHHPGIGKTGVVAVVRGRSDASGRAVG